jgi:uncharacterized protein YqgC (DUF456 family)
MEIALIIIGIICLIVGITFSIVPPLPGPPIAWAALLLLVWHDGVEGPSTQFLVLWGLIAVASTFMDNLLSIWGTKFTGGSKAGTWGAMVGLIVGLFVGPLGILIGPFVGAVLFELASGAAFPIAVKSGIGAFLGFIAGSLLKVGISIWITVLWCQKLWF